MTAIAKDKIILLCQSVARICTLLYELIARDTPMNTSIKLLQISDEFTFNNLIPRPDSHADHTNN